MGAGPRHRFIGSKIDRNLLQTGKFGISGSEPAQIRRDDRKLSRESIDLFLLHSAIERKSVK
jgi:hypothetical protein